MDDFTIARVLHVLAVSMWMGGVAFVTTIVMPFIRRSSPPAERLEAFHHFEGRVAPQTSFWVLAVGVCDGLTVSLLDGCFLSSRYPCGWGVSRSSPLS